ncbi:MAG: HAD-IB family hydrolase [Brachymonas sp.]|nr:HAD-IB family hydrolase [Brachymonas sp.]
MPQRLHIALFDLDHTLLPIDSDYTWTTYTNAMGWTRPEEVEQQNEVFFAQYKAGTLDMNDYVRFVTQPVRDFSPQQLQATLQRYVQEYIVPHIRPEALELLAQHRAAGETLVMTTATNRLIGGAVGQHLGFAGDHILSTELQFRDDGRITGDVAGEPNLREGKVHNFGHWLAARGLGYADVHITFYSDSMNDLPLLEKADVPVATNPDDALRAVAQQRGWRVLDLFETIA